MSGRKRSAGAVRQLSLQQPTPRRQQIRRQRSADDDKVKQMCQNQVIRGRLATASSGPDKTKLRIAWEEGREEDERANKVEVTARQIPGRTKPGVIVRAGRISAEKAAIRYSRQDLAERLRLAWKHRQKNGANIDIFLAHGTVEKRCDSELSSHRSGTVSTTPLPLEEMKHSTTDANENYSDEIHIHDEICPKDDCLREDCRALIDSNNYIDSKKKQEEYSILLDGNGESKRETRYFFHEYSKERNSCKLVEEEKDSVEKKIPETGANNIAHLSMKDLNEEDKQTTTFDHSIEALTEDNFHDDFGKLETGLHENTNCTRDATNFSITTPLTPVQSNKTEGEELDGSKMTKNEFCLAKQKRASFQSGANRAFQTPVIDQVTSMGNKVASAMDRIVQPKPPNNFKLDLKTKRTNSAPPQRRPATAVTKTQMNIVIDTPGIPGVVKKSLAEKLTSDSKNAAITKCEEVLIKIPRNRAIRSAPLKKRSKSAKRRSFDSCKDDDENRGRPRSQHGERAKGNFEGRTADVVTMVSLVSSADSDSDIEKSPDDDKLIDALRSKLPTTPIIKTFNQPSGIRKPVKSVSFQEDSTEENSIITKQSPAITETDKTIVQSRSAALKSTQNASTKDEDSVATWRTEIACKTVPLLFPIQKEVAGVDAQLTDREKRCLAVPIGDAHDKKRKLLKMRSTPIRPTHFDRTLDATKMKEQSCGFTLLCNESQANQSIASAQNSALKENPIQSVPVKEEEAEVVTTATEPNIHTTKEKECWHLYRRMCDKGVYVSFDTVLRGMLTPTEYRMRQKKLVDNL